jgi:hypothetical protein
MSATNTLASKAHGSDWDDFPFDIQITLPGIPEKSVTSTLHVSVKPTPLSGSFILRGRLADGRTRSVRLNGTVYAAKLPFADPTLRIQYLDDTSAVQLNLESYVLA